MADLNVLAQAIINGEQGQAEQLTKEALSEGMIPKSILDEGLIAGMNVVGERFKKNEMYIPEVLIAAHAMKGAMVILEPELVKAGVEPIAKLIIGTVQGDMHDIGKNLVAMMLKGAGFEVIDLGVDVKPEQFIEEAKSNSVHLIGMSALLTTTMPGMEKTVQACKKAGINVKTMIGGAPVTQEYADKIGADGFATDAATAVDIAKSLVA
ncbi:MAG: corrinoid protein [Planctomycetota bacterium]|jgi:5-methyltetrahydrofolate--homocysteine methyltransferase